MKLRIVAQAIILTLVMFTWAIFGAIATQVELDKVSHNKPEICRSEVSGQRVKCPS